MPVPSLRDPLRSATRAACTSIACAALIAACAVTSRGAGDTKVALVIGNAAYENALELRNPVNDAADMCSTLHKLGFKALCHTNLRDRADFEARVKEYVAQLVPGSVGVFYYSGHGVQVDSASFLVPTRVQPAAATENPQRMLYAVPDLLRDLDHRRTKFQLVILDACRTDLFPQAQSPSGSAPGSKGPNGAVRPPPIKAPETSRQVGSGLAAITNAPAETVVFYATAAKAAAYDGDGRNGPLTKHILDHIGTIGLKVEEFFKRVTLGVVTETTRRYEERQTPFTYGSLSGDFCFAGCWRPNDGVVPPAN
jgi:uncharacterized caspase-like protein